MTISRFDIIKKPSGEEKLRLYYDQPCYTNSIYDSLVVRLYPQELKYGYGAYYDYIWPDGIINNASVNGIEIHLIDNVFIGVTPTTISDFNLSSMAAMLSKNNMITAQCANELIACENRRLDKSIPQQKKIDGNKISGTVQLFAPLSSQEKKSAAPVYVKYWNEFSAALQSYIITFQSKPGNSAIIRNLNLSSSEEDLFDDKHRDPITDDVMDIPVFFKDKVYDLDTLLKASIKANSKSNDPYCSIDNMKFSLRELQPAKHMATQIQEVIQTINRQRENQNRRKASP